MKTFYFLLCFMGSHSLLQATHNKAGEITFRQIDATSVEATITTYTTLSSLANHDRDSLTLCWGDGLCERVPRVNGPDFMGEDLGKDLQLNIYVASHTYATKSEYELHVTDPNRDAEIINVNFPFSETVPFHLQTYLKLDDTLLNSSPFFVEKPIDVAWVGVPFVHIPNAYDSDGDSLVYELVTPLQGVDEPVTNYDTIVGLEIDSFSGKVVWENPAEEGAYVIAIAVSSFRDGILVDRVMRDMQINVKQPPGLFSPPSIDLNNYEEGVLYDYEVGESVTISVSFSDMDADQTITVRSSSGLYQEGFASFVLDGDEGLFEWNVTGESVRSAPYHVVLCATDDLNSLGMTNCKVVSFKQMQSSGTKSTKQGSAAVFPNPATNFINVPIAKGAQSLQVVDLAGRTVLQLNEFATHSQINISGLNEGLYFLSWNEDGRQHLSRFIKIEGMD